MAVSSVSFMLLDIVKVYLIRNWSFEMTAKLWPSRKNKAKLKSRQERASLLQRVDSNVTRLKKAVTMARVVSAFKGGLKSIKQASKSVLNLSGLETVRSRRASVDMTSRQPSISKLDGSNTSKYDAITIVDLKQSNPLDETDQAEESPTSDSNQ
jgi:hypothetical protein